jgi:hypothetical protein
MFRLASQHLSNPYLEDVLGISPEDVRLNECAYTTHYIQDDDKDKKLKNKTSYIANYYYSFNS